MDRMFNVEIMSEDDYAVTLTLPATDYELLDALEQLRVGRDANIDWDILSFEHHGHLRSWIGSGSLYELNALARKLSDMSEHDSIAFDGLVEIERKKGIKTIPVGRLIDLAYNAETCHVAKARSEADLGKFFLENGFLPEYENLPDNIVENLDFAKIGREMCESEGGILISRGYVVQTEDIEEVHKGVDLTLRRPIYAAIIEAGIMDTGLCTRFWLPASETVLNAAKETLGVESWDQVSFRCADCRIPDLRDTFSTSGNIDEMNTVAQILKSLTDEETRTCKAVVRAMKVDTLSSAEMVMTSLDDYVASPEFRSFDDVGKAEIDFQINSETAQILKRFVSLYDFGKAMAEHDNMILTEYGGIERRDRQPIQKIDPPSSLAAGRMEIWSRSASMSGPRM